MRKATGENCIMRSLIVYIHHQILGIKSGHNMEEEMGWRCSGNETHKFTKSSSENLKEKAAWQRYA
jgi:hypothetical protein